MREQTKKLALGIVLTFVALGCLYAHIDYSGWVLFVGLATIYLVQLMTQRKPRSYREIGTEIIATLMHGDRTWIELADQVGISANSADGWLCELRKSGVIRVAGYARRHETGRPARVYSLQTKPFALPDVVYVIQGRKTVRQLAEQRARRVA